MKKPFSTRHFTHICTKTLNNILLSKFFMREPKVAIVILNWNGKDYTIKCIESLKNISYQNYKIIVIDNGSTDGSQTEIKRKFPSVLLIENKKNLGFAKGVNVGIKRALEDKNVEYIFLLNNDTIVEQNCLKELIRVAENNRKKRVGMFQPKVLNMDNPKIIDTTGHIFKFGRIVDRGKGEIDRGQYDNKTDIIGACAAAALYKRKMLEDIGLFNEEYYIGYEDAELSWRAYKRGWKAKYVPEAIVYHKRHGTINKTSSKLKIKLHYISLENQILTVRRYGTIIQRLLFTSFLLYTGAVIALKNIINKENGINAAPYILGIKKLLWR